MTLTITLPDNCSLSQFKRELAKAIKGLERMRKEMFGKVPVEVKRTLKGWKQSGK